MSYLGKDLLYILIIFSVFVVLAPHAAEFDLASIACSVSGTSDWPVSGYLVGANKL